MTVASDVQDVTYATDGSTVGFPIPFYFLVNSHIAAELVAADDSITPLVYGSDFTLSGAGDPDGGEFTALTPFASGYDLHIYRDVPVTQETQYQQNDAFPAKTTEKALDKLTMIAQQHGVRLSRALMFPRGESLSGLQPYLPPRAQRANNALGFNAQGNPIALQLLVATALFPSVPNLVLARAISNPLTTTVVVGGHDFQGDGGGGVYLKKQDVAPPDWDNDGTRFTSILGVAFELLPMGPVSVKVFGARGDQVTDDTEALQRAFAACEHLYVPAGVYLHSDELKPPTGRLTYIEGDGVGLSVFELTDLTKNGITFDLNYVQGGGIEKLTIRCRTVNPTDAGSTGIGLSILNANDNFVVDRVDVANYDYSFRNVGSFQATVTNFRFIYFRKAGLWLPPSDGTPAAEGAGNRYALGKISNFGFTGDNSESIGALVQWASGEFLAEIDITACNENFVARPTATSTVRYLIGLQVLGDTGQSVNWLFDASLGGTIISCQFFESWSGNSQGTGIKFQGVNMDAIDWYGGWVRDSRHDGVDLAGGSNVHFHGTQITRNSAAAANSYDGVIVRANVNSWAFLGCRIGNIATTTATGVQRYAINIEAGTSQGFRILNNDLNDNGAPQPIANGSSSLNFKISGNLPVAVFGANTSERIAYSGASGSAVPAGTTGYLGPNGFQGGFNDSVYVLTKPQVVCEFFVGCAEAPGDGQSFIYTVMLNGAPTVMTGLITGAGSFSVFVTGGARFQGNPQDRITLRVVSSSGATVTKHWFYIVGEP
ncbi:glycosyl hydrolase family 28-related protein [Burkholderia gladioli]|uniref:glycosyl hydrolase family 28-related protein n=1 Tax=Burkholderia gladioli TaxID=28095 RepID=UPI000CFE8F57|nr:glycosyl hydrolase family 28-related protein [Burkholderia gladioli]PRE78299.1 hypothetical protein C6Q13_33940 [Burkholderia gladioli]